jgi:long-subunit fatty acid transport protein
LAGLGCAIALLGAVSAGAQPLNIPRFNFSFSNPGARSLGFGGAFSALADDATAAYANPAGLVQLVEPEVSLEARLWNRSPSFLAGGRAEGAVTGRGVDTRQGPVFGRDDSRDFGASFVSVVVPKGRWSFALYGHRLAKFEQSAESQGFFIDSSEPFSIPPGGRILAGRERVDLDIASTGFAAGWRMNDRLSFGLGLVYSKVSLRTLSESYLADDDGDEARYGEIHFLPGRLYTTDVLTVEGSDLTLNAGVLGRLTDQLTGSLFYRQGAETEGVSRFDSGPVFPFPGFPLEISARNEVTFAVPDVGGAGLAYRSKGGAVTLAAEVDRVGYSGLLRLRSLDEEEDGSDAGRGYEDAWEYHAGAEYALLGSNPILAFRAGYWVEANGDDQFDQRVDHIAAGLGLVAKKVQLDLAGDFSDEGDTVSLSCIYTF